MDNLYNLLASGKTAEELAAEFTQNLNKAEAQYKADMEAKRNSEARRNEMAELIRAIETYLIKYFPNYTGEAKPLSDETLNIVTDTILNLLDVEEAKSKKKVHKIVVGDHNVDFSADLDSNAAFAEFFEAFGL